MRTPLLILQVQLLFVIYLFSPVPHFIDYSHRGVGPYGPEAASQLSPSDDYLFYDPDYPIEDYASWFFSNKWIEGWSVFKFCKFSATRLISRPGSCQKPLSWNPDSPPFRLIHNICCPHYAWHAIPISLFSLTEKAMPYHTTCIDQVSEGVVFLKLRLCTGSLMSRMLRRWRYLWAKSFS